MWGLDTDGSVACGFGLGGFLGGIGLSRLIARGFGLNGFLGGFGLSRLIACGLGLRGFLGGFSLSRALLRLGAIRLTPCGIRCAACFSLRGECLGWRLLGGSRLTLRRVQPRGLRSSSRPAFRFSLGAGLGRLGLRGFLSGLGAGPGGGDAFRIHAFRFDTGLLSGFLRCFAASGFFPRCPGGFGWGWRTLHDRRG